MRRLILVFPVVLFSIGLVSCKETLEWPADDDDFLSQELVITKSDGTEVKTKNKLAIGNKESYPIGSVFVGGGIADPSKGASHRCHFYMEPFTEGPNWDQVNPIVFIRGFWHNGTDYKAPGQCIDFIGIAMDQTLGYGDSLIIPMNQGKYEGGCDLVKDVKINSYSFSSYQEDLYTINDDGKIDIRILLKDGTKISILFAGKTPYDGYY